jgi:hypothetical protein
MRRRWAFKSAVEAVVVIASLMAERTRTGREPDGVFCRDWGDCRSAAFGSDGAAGATGRAMQAAEGEPVPGFPDEQVGAIKACCFPADG